MFPRKSEAKNDNGMHAGKIVSLAVFAIALLFALTAFTVMTEQNDAEFEFYLENPADSDITIQKSQSATVMFILKDNISKPSYSFSSSYLMVTEKKDVIGGKYGIVINALEGGFSTVTVTCDSTTIVINVTVPIHVTGITLDKTEVTVEEGKTASVIASITPTTANDKVLVWSSDNTSVATVSSSMDPATSSSKGTIKGLAEGTATITVYSHDEPSIKKTCTVKVIKAVSNIELTAPTLYNNGVDNIKYVAYEITPSGDYSSTWKWTSSDPSKITVDQTGKVTGVSVGTSVITLTIGSATKSCTVSYSDLPVTDINLSASDLKIFVGEQTTLTASLVPTNPTNKKVSWTSNSPGVAELQGTVTNVNAGTVTIKGKSAGTAIITVTSADGNHTKQCTIEVEPVAVTEVRLDKASMDILVGERFTLTSSVNPSNATYKNLEWSTSNASVVKLLGEASGVLPGTMSLEAVGIGEATITVASVDGIHKASCVVKVQPYHVTGVSMDTSTLLLEINESKTLGYTIFPSNATDKAVTWTSSKPSVATVDSTGKVVATGPGAAEITVTTHDGGFTATCKVTVSKECILEAEYETTASGNSIITNKDAIISGIKIAKDAGVTPTVLIDIPNNDKVTFYADIINALRGASEGTLNIYLAKGGIEFSNETLNAMRVADGDTVGFSIKDTTLPERFDDYRPYYAYDICYYLNDVQAKLELSKDMRITLFHDLAEGEVASKLKVCYIYDDKSAYSVKNEPYDINQAVVFSTNHLSKYMFTFTDKVVSNGSFNSAVIIVFAIIVVIALLISIMFMRSSDDKSAKPPFQRRFRNPMRPY
jgi:uncharacterized protein YjdB